MLIGHYAPALALKRLSPEVPLWQLFVGVQLLDFAWAAFVLADVEHARVVPGFTASNDLDLYDMPWSHSLVAALAWSFAAGLGAWLAHRRGPRSVRGAATIGGAVVSHWVLDAVVHVPDLTLAGDGSPRVGMGLWNAPVAAAALELALVGAAGAALVIGGARGRAAKRMGLLVGALLVVALLSFVTPQPATPTETTATALALYVMLAGLAWLAERGPRDQAAER